MADSFYPAVQKVLSHAAIRWAGGVLGTALLGLFTIYIWPAVSTWAASRVSNTDLIKAEARVGSLEAEHKIEYKNLNLANTDDTGALSHGSQVEWLIIRMKRMQMREVQHARRLICAEAKLKMPSPRSDAAKKACKDVVLKFDEFIKEQRPVDEAARSAMDFVFGSD